MGAVQTTLVVMPRHSSFRVGLLGVVHQFLPHLAFKAIDHGSNQMDQQNQEK